MSMNTIQIKTKFKVGDEFYAYNQGRFRSYTILSIDVEAYVSDEYTTTTIKYGCISNTVGIAEHKKIAEEDALTAEEIKNMINNVAQPVQDETVEA